MKQSGRVSGQDGRMPRALRQEPCKSLCDWTPTGEIRIGPDLLPDLDTTDLDHPAGEDVAARHPEGEGPVEDAAAEEKDAGAR